MKIRGMERFAQLARTDAPTLDLLALAIAGALREVDEAAALAELDRLAGELSNIMGWIEQLAEFDTDGVEPMTSVAAATLPCTSQATAPMVPCAPSS